MESRLLFSKVLSHIVIDKLQFIGEKAIREVHLTDKSKFEALQKIPPEKVEFFM